jgi:predicted DNA-binding protein with PD1-like motif
MTATFTAIGVLKNAQVEFCDQEKHEYMEMLLCQKAIVAWAIFLECFISRSNVYN